MKELKEFYKSHRLGVAVEKTLLWIWVKRDLAKMKGEVGIDLAGGRMLTKRFFSTKNYICVDIDQQKLDSGMNSNPDAVAVNMRIQDFLKDSRNQAPDALVCLQTFGTNTLFEHDQTIDVVKEMARFLRQGGGMIFNIGSDCGNLREAETQLHSLLAEKFESVKIKHYGAMHRTKRKASSIDLVWAYCMHYVPPLRTMLGLQVKRVYFCCNRKL